MSGKKQRDLAPRIDHLKVRLCVIKQEIDRIRTDEEVDPAGWSERAYQLLREII